MKRSSMILAPLAVAALAALLAGLELFAPGKSIEAEHQGQRVRFSVDRGIQVFRRLNASWKVDRPAFVRFDTDGDPRLPEGSAPVAGRDRIELHVTFKDMATETYVLPVCVLFKTPSGQGILALMSLLALATACLWGSFFRGRDLAATPGAPRRRSFPAGADRLHFLALLAVLAAALWIRLYYLNQPLRLDEASTLQRFAGPAIPLSEGLSNYAAPNNHLLNTLLMHLSILLFSGTELWVLRLPAFAAGFLLVPVLYGAGRAFFGREAALIAASLAAVSPPLVLFSTNARGYAWVLLCFMGMLWAAHSLRRGGRAGAWIAFILAGTLGFFAIPSMIYPFGIVTAWLALAILRENTGSDRVRHLKNLALACALSIWLAALLYVPVLTNWGWEGLTGSPFSQSADSLAQFAAHLSPFLGKANQLFFDGWPLGLVLLLHGGAALALIFRPKTAGRAAPIAWVALAFLVLVGIIQKPMFEYPRLLLFLLPLYFLYAGAGLAFLLSRIPASSAKKAGLSAMAALALAGAGAFATVRSEAVLLSFSTGRLPDAEAISIFLKDRLQPGDRVLCGKTVESYLLEYYFERHGVDTQCLREDLSVAKRIFVVFTPWPRDARVEDLLDTYLSPERRKKFFGPAVPLRTFDPVQLYAFQRIAEEARKGP